MSIPLTQLLRPELGPSGFHDFRAQFAPLWDLLALFRRADLSLVPDQWLHHANRGLGLLRTAIDTMRGYQPDLNLSPIQQRSAAIKPFLDSYNELYNALVGAVSLGLPITADAKIGKLESGISEALAKLGEEIEQKKSEWARSQETSTKAAMARLADAEREAGRALESIRKAAGAAGVGRESKQFDVRAEAHKKQGTRWLMATGVLVVATAFYAYALAFRSELIPYAGDVRALIVQVAGRLVLASLLLWALAVAQRNYKAHRHNEILNRHRQTALSTFESFVDASANPDIKDAVLVQTTQSIFSVQPTGYLPNEPETTPQTTIVEILRRFTEKP